MDQASGGVSLHAFMTAEEIADSRSTRPQLPLDAAFRRALATGVMVVVPPGATYRLSGAIDIEARG